MVTKQLRETIRSILTDLGIVGIKPQVESPADASHGDYSTNIALVAAKKLGKKPREVAEEIIKQLTVDNLQLTGIEKAEVAGAGFINFWISKEELMKSLSRTHPVPPLSSRRPPPYGRPAPLLKREGAITSKLKDKKIFIEYAHPNTHKEMHIGHMRTLITGESIARLLEAAGATVFRANYQGDIGPHIAKALYGIEKLMEEKELSLEEISQWSNKDKTHFLGEGYVRGNKDYDEQKDIIDGINQKLYGRDPAVWMLYQQTRKWNLDYYKEFYNRFYTTFDRLFFESEMDKEGVKIVKSHIGDVFEKSNDTIVFPGEKYGLHTRVFITDQGYPTYEGKEMANAFSEYETFPFDLKMHIVASEQSGYFQVVFKALELIDPEKFKNKQLHLSMGMVHLKDPPSHKATGGQVRKMSSRTGDVLTVDWLLDQVKERVESLAGEGRIVAEEREKTIEQIVIGAVKYSVLKVATTQDAAFNIETSVSLEGNSGPYLQYVYARTQSVLRKAENKSYQLSVISYQLEDEELLLLRLLYKFDETVVAAAEKYSPNILCNYLFELAQLFNLFYQKRSILNPSTSPSPSRERTEPSEGVRLLDKGKEGRGEGETRDFRLALTAATGNTIKTGLHLLGIQAPDKM